MIQATLKRIKVAKTKKHIKRRDSWKKTSCQLQQYDKECCVIKGKKLL